MTVTLMEVTTEIGSVKLEIMKINFVVIGI
jgi:hypothetical protein